MIRFTPPDGSLDLAQTLDCGQAFRWRPVSRPDGVDAWRGVAFSRVLEVWTDGDTLCLDCTQAEFDEIWFSYFDFQTDYAEMRASLAGLHPF